MAAAPAPQRRRSQRGDRRRQLLLDAAGELLMEQGFAGVSHRSVAQRAELPLSATTYYFASLDDLLADVVQFLADGWLRAARDALDQLPERLDGPRQLARAVLQVVALAPAGVAAGSPGAILPLYERYLEAARHPSLRPTIVRYDDHLDSLLVELLRRAGLDPSRDDARLVLAVVDGASLRALAEGSPPDSAVRPLEHVLQVLASRA